MLAAGSSGTALAHHLERQDGFGPPHFGHPLVAESPSPDTKLRLDYLYRNEDGANRHTGNLEGEYAFAPWVSLEADLPYTFLDPDGSSGRSNLDNVEIALKLATTLVPGRALIGGGLELGLPTGDDDKGIGSSREIEVAPFLDFGVKNGAMETVAFVKFAIPTNQPPDEADAVDLEIIYNVAFSHDWSEHLRLLLEFDGSVVAAGTASESILNITPGIKVRPVAGIPLDFGLGVSVPLTSDKAFDTKVIFSGFYHF